MLCVPIGSWTIVGPKCMCGSTNPGAITWPGASLTVFTSAGSPSRTCFSDPTATMCPDGLTGNCLRDGVLRVDGEDRSDVHGRYVRVVLPRTAAPDCDGEALRPEGFPPPEEVPHDIVSIRPTRRFEQTQRAIKTRGTDTLVAMPYSATDHRRILLRHRAVGLHHRRRGPRRTGLRLVGVHRQNTLDWCRALKKVTYTSPRPYDEKTTRTAVLAAGAITLNEQFFIWDEDPPSTSIDTPSTPRSPRVPDSSSSASSEVTPSPGGRSRIVWKFAMRTSGVALPSFLSTPISAAAFGSVKRDTVKHFQLT